MLLFTDQSFVCCVHPVLQVIQTVSAVDKDLPPVGQRFFFKSPKELRNRNFTVRDFGSKKKKKKTKRERSRDVFTIHHYLLAAYVSLLSHVLCCDNVSSLTQSDQWVNRANFWDHHGNKQYRAHGSRWLTQLLHLLSPLATVLQSVCVYISLMIIHTHYSQHIFWGSHFYFIEKKNKYTQNNVRILQ